MRNWKFSNHPNDCTYITALSKALAPWPPPTRHSPKQDRQDSIVQAAVALAGYNPPSIRSRYSWSVLRSRRRSFYRRRSSSSCPRASSRCARPGSYLGTGTSAAWKRTVMQFRLRDKETFARGGFNIVPVGVAWIFVCNWRQFLPPRVCVVMRERESLCLKRRRGWVWVKTECIMSPREK